MSNISEQAFHEYLLKLEFIREVLSYRNRWLSWIDIYEWARMMLLIFGIPGSFLAFITMIWCPLMHTQSFIYHKALVGSDLMFTVNWGLTTLLKSSLVGQSSKDPIFSTNLGAFYVCVLSRVLIRVCSNFSLYMSLCVALDRFVCVVLPWSYRKHNRSSVTKALIIASLCLSLFIHSWSSWFDDSVARVTTVISNDSTPFAYTCSQRPPFPLPPRLIYAKDVYNLVFLLLCPVILLVFTGTTIFYVIKRRRKWAASSTLRYAESFRGYQDEPTNYGLQQDSATNHTFGSHRRTNDGRKCSKERGQRVLLRLMGTAVVLALLQIAPNAADRVMDLVHPKEFVQPNNINNLTPEEQQDLLNYLRNYERQKVFPQMLAYSFGALDRCLVFYVYFGMNPFFRRQVFDMFRAMCRRCCGCQWKGFHSTPAFNVYEKTELLGHTDSSSNKQEGRSSRQTNSLAAFDPVKKCSSCSNVAQVHVPAVERSEPPNEIFV